MTISLNGEKTETRGATTIEELVSRFELPAQSILVEHNGCALHRREWPNKLLSEGDRIEFIRVGAGG
jgi:thiamine biosynthesis protein ThiS